MEQPYEACLATNVAKSATTVKCRSVTGGYKGTNVSDVDVFAKADDGEDEGRGRKNPKSGKNETSDLSGASFDPYVANNGKRVVSIANDCDYLDIAWEACYGITANAEEDDDDKDDDDKDDKEDEEQGQEEATLKQDSSQGKNAKKSHTKAVVKVKAKTKLRKSPQKTDSQDNPPFAPMSDVQPEQASPESTGISGTGISTHSPPRIRKFRENDNEDDMDDNQPVTSPVAISSADEVNITFSADGTVVDNYDQQDGTSTSPQTLTTAHAAETSALTTATVKNTKKKKKQPPPSIRSRLEARLNGKNTISSENTSTETGQTDPSPKDAMFVDLNDTCQKTTTGTSSTSSRSTSRSSGDTDNTDNPSPVQVYTVPPIKADAISPILPHRSTTQQTSTSQEQHAAPAPLDLVPALSTPMSPDASRASSSRSTASQSTKLPSTSSISQSATLQASATVPQPHPLKLQRQLLVARRGQWPRWWQDFEEITTRIRQSKTYCIMAFVCDDVDNGWLDDELRWVSEDSMKSGKEGEMLHARNDRENSVVDRGMSVDGADEDDTALHLMNNQAYLDAVKSTHAHMFQESLNTAADIPGNHVANGGASFLQHANIVPSADTTVALNTAFLPWRYNVSLRNKHARFLAIQYQRYAAYMSRWRALVDGTAESQQ